MIKSSYHPNCTIRNSCRANCTIENCYVAICTIANSYLANSMITNSYLANCTIGNKLRRFDEHSLLTQWVKPLGLISHLTTSRWVSLSLREKCPNTKFFLVSIYSYLDWVWRFTPQISVFSPNTGKYGTEKTPYLDSFYAVGHANVSCSNYR